MTPEQRTAVLLAPGELEAARAALDAIRAEVEGMGGTVEEWELMACVNENNAPPWAVEFCDGAAYARREAIAEFREHLASLRRILNGVDGAATGGER